MAVLTASEVRESFLEGLSGTGVDAVLTKFITRASRMIAAYLGYPKSSATAPPTIESTSYTRYLGENDVESDDRILRLDVLPVTAITSIYDDLDGNFDASHLVAATDYEIRDGAIGLVWLKHDSVHGIWQKGDQNIKATFTAGYATSPSNLVPDDLVHAHGQLVRWMWQGKKTFGLRNLSEGGVSIGLNDPAGIPSEIRDLLDPHRLPRALL